MYAGKVVALRQLEDPAEPAPMEHAVEMEYYVDVPVSSNPNATSTNTT